MRILGIDYGEKRIGLAVSDESFTLARELTIVSPKEFWKILPELVIEYEFQAIALGHPLNMDGHKTEKTGEVENFKLNIERVVSVPVTLVDERLSSSMAEKLPGGRINVDSMAAQIILQNYLDKKKALSA